MSWRNLIWMTIILSLAGLAFYLSRREPPKIPPTDPAVAELAGAVKAYKLIQSRSYRTLRPDSACRGAIEGMVRQVDRFCVYVPPGQVGPLSRRVAGELNETGLRIASQAGALVVVGAMPGSPAHRARLFGGEEILAVNGIPADELSLEEARRMVSAVEGTSVSLLLRRERGNISVQELQPARFDAETVTGLLRSQTGGWVTLLDAKTRIFYLRVGEFVSRTPAELQAVYRSLEDPRAIILDLRDNPGGVLAAAAEVADRFLAEGLIVRVVPRQGKEQLRYAHADGTYPALPVVVLIDGATASAAEIVAGALQAHGRAMLVGLPSYGKWSVYSLFSLSGDLGKVYLPTAEYFLAEPSPATQHSQPATAPAEDEQVRPGLSPDVRVGIPIASAQTLETLRLRALVAVPPTEGSAPATRPAERQDLQRLLLAADKQLAEALRLLRERRVPTTRPSRPEPGSLPRP